MLETSAFVFASDLADEGIDTVLDNVERRAGLGGIMPAFVYHAARDVFPHNPARRVVLQNAGACFFRPEPRLYEASAIRPEPSALVRERDVLGDACRAASARGLAVHAWTVFLHTDRPGEHPACAPTNAFGDLYDGELCPANPDVRAYVRALVADISRYEIASILAESLHYHGLEHGYHHERYFVALDPVARYLLGLCFCDHCLAAARGAGVDAAGVHGAVRSVLDRVFRDGEVLSSVPEVTREALGGFAGGELDGYLDARAETVATLAAEAAEVAESAGRRFVFLDHMGAVKGYATGRPEGAPAAESAWRLGVDLARVARSCHGLEAIGYAAEVERLRLDLEAYRAFAGDGTDLGVALRPCPPDCDEPANLAAKVALANELGLARADFYHYGFVRLDALDWVLTAQTTD